MMRDRNLDGAMIDDGCFAVKSPLSIARVVEWQTLGT